MRSSATALRQATLAERDADCLRLVEPARRKDVHEPATRSPGDRIAEELRAQAIRDIEMILGFRAEVFDPVMRAWVRGFAVHSEFPRPTARALHAAALRRRGLTNTQIAKVLHLKTNRVSVLRWRGEGFLMCVEATMDHEETRLSSRIRL
jgi:hypothetical protein